MHLAKVKDFPLFFLILFFLCLSSAILVANKGKSQRKDVYSQNQEQRDEPTVENMLKAKQAGDFEKAARIQAILNEEAKKFWRSPGGDDRRYLLMILG
jgi:hypothetical protein